ncbi:monovalent cation/H+ antiporter subunit A [Rivibacter subsaxonicus]|uniref:Multisubunit potassium/proton antiporter PhaA subunit /multisubunit potassium/proton antiporter PhaB subunit n=1 Tax=Rivibacter subsaxonicus TaxID=457575 RepID=A0A4Q7VCR4_9BURK|nr:monovalent cation/H+ antiporter subunit A [Rivibacter subsaxonicus]RZT93644.1 multisubunit potassium/proton antiporter PhaA subunit /multisubunit potassium/proton antiporter PhaB subunit [Rivibacter subsaxonicus]
MTELLLPLVVLLPLLPGVLLTAWAGRRRVAGALPAWIAAAVTLAALAILLSLAPEVFAGRTLLAHRDWVPELGLSFGLRLDGLALLFGLLITGIGALVVLYGQYYLGPDDPRGKFYALLMLFMAAMLGVVLADNLLLLVVFWELTSISSFLLVGYWGHKAEARAGARMALAVTGGGGLALLAGVVLLGQIGGSYELSELLGRGDVVRAHPLYPAALCLILLGCFTKSAQWPFHFWLPEAMAAPTPASAYLHSATMVKAGVFLIARLYPVLGGSLLFEVIVAGTGLLTLAFAAYIAVYRHDLKGLLAYSTISHLGLIVFLLGLDSPLSAVAAVFHVINHATFKASLFMTAGIIDHETGTRDMRQLSGLLRYMPWTATLAMVAAASMAGVPLFNGFLSKEMFFAEALAAVHAGWGWIVPVVATFAGACSVAYSARFVHDVFFNGELGDLPRPHPHEPPLFMKLPVALLVGLCILVGVLPALTVGPLVQVAADAVLGAPAPRVRLALWHGFNLPLVMSLIATVSGLALYWALQRRFDLHLHHPRGLTGRLLFTHAVDHLFGLAGRVTARLENGSLQRYAALMLAAALVVGGWPLLGADLGTGARALTPVTPLALALWLLLLACGAALLRWHRQRFTAVVLVGVIGLVAALAFASLSAPDLALTQLAVEVISAVLLMLGLALLPTVAPRESSALRRTRDALLALAGGGAIGWLAWLVMTREHDSISWFFLQNALPQGGGNNVVNVILVDFRGFDTFGEITVLAIAGIGALAMLDGLRLRRPALDEANRPWRFATHPLLLRALARLVLPLALVFSLHLFWRGHNLPGGGFVAGLITAAALVLQYMALGQARADAILHAAGGRRFTAWVGSGLLVAALTGAGAMAFGEPFLTSAFGHPVVPLLGELALASAALFDLGVYLTVVGATLLALSVLGAVSRTPATMEASAR